MHTKDTTKFDYSPEIPQKLFFFLVAAYGTFGSVRMLFGLRNEGATYERMVDSVFHDQLGQNMEFYVDDMLEKALKAAYHVKDLEEVF